GLAQAQNPAARGGASQASASAGKKGPPPRSVQSITAQEPEPLGPVELEIAERVHTGPLPCELGASVRLEPDPQAPGYFHLHGKGFRYRMRPVSTTTGAIRLEDAKSGAVWLQLGNKSMLMDQKKGRRVADECAHPDQVAFAREMRENPPPRLFETDGMGRKD
ncbi:MAG: hypothetical protein ACKODU_10200, partial [Limnohabitans sp.]